MDFDLAKEVHTREMQDTALRKRIELLEKQVARLLEAVPSAQARHEHAEKLSAQVDEEIELEQLSDAEFDRRMSEPIDDDLPF